MSSSRVGAEHRRLVADRAHGCCEYCLSQRRFSPDPFAVEHVIPESRQGPTVPDNLALSCQGCNGHKFTAIEAPDPLSLKLVPLYHPRLDQWQDHFRWSEDFLQILGTSATGRATIVRLRLNRKEVVNLRELLTKLDKHPPDYDY
ncbi:MAG: HNH endonuclease signature motif containing protein [Planctomycetota bacterium]|nr:HNH endonuclease signature motif containing protein [Planctomycetota bacterium]